jgi:hypothetical protein
LKNLPQNLTKELDWDCLSPKILWKLMVVKYGLRIMVIIKMPEEEELYLDLAYQSAKKTATSYATRVK